MTKLLLNPNLQRLRLECCVRDIKIRVRRIFLREINLLNTTLPTRLCYGFLALFHINEEPIIKEEINLDDQNRF